MPPDSSSRQPFDWIPFFQQYRIEFVTRGSNVAVGHVNIKCPFCGPADPSHHMGVQLSTGFWGCWRNTRHRGRAPQSLVAALLRVSWHDADSIVDSARRPAASGDWDDMKRRLLVMSSSVKDAPIQALTFDPVSVPRHFFFLDAASPARASRFLKYLVDERSFCHPREVAACYRLMGTLLGPFKFRLIFPIMMYGQMVGWTGRAITHSQIRYKAFPSGPMMRQMLFNYDNAAAGGHILVVVEGPVDALKVDYYGAEHGIRSIALLGTAVTPTRAGLIMELAERYDLVLLLLDPTAKSQALDAQSMLPASNLIRRDLTQAEDPGELAPDQVVPVIKELAYS